MSKLHLDHPTQHAACGATTTVKVVDYPVLMMKPESQRCKSCLKVYRALVEGRKVFSGHDDGAGDVGPRRMV